MKQLFYSLALLSVLLVFGCQNDDDDGPSTTNTLQYDGDNATGPLLPAGEYEAAVRFPASFTKDYVGRFIESISFFIGIPPAGLTVVIYEEGTASQPGNVIFEQTVNVSALSTPNWNQLNLPTPIEIFEEDIWISIALTHDQQQQSIGCDAGPNRANGDWLFQDSDNDWRTYTERTGESINWNIRANLQE